MKELNLIRISETENGTFGVLLDGDEPFCLTLERKWLENKTNESCIPVGEYECKMIVSYKFGTTFEVLNVPDRSGILFHKGNWMDDSKGCIILGEEYAQLNGKTAVASSGRAFSEFYKRVVPGPFKLRIYEHSAKGQQA